MQKNVSCGPQAIHIGKRDDSRMSTAVCRLCGQDPGGPSGVAAQSTAARSRPTSSSAANIPAAPDSGSASAARATGRPLLHAPGTPLTQFGVVNAKWLHCSLLIVGKRFARMREAFDALVTRPLGLEDEHILAGQVPFLDPVSPPLQVGVRIGK